MALADPTPQTPPPYDSTDPAMTGDRARVFMSAREALVHLLLEQSRRDQAAGFHTAGYVTGYRGSPLGGLDQELIRAAPRLSAVNIRFQPGLNEELAATALWGSQQVGLFDGAKQDGVFGLWYGKGPGVDRAGDALKHANLAGTAPLGGVLAVAGDDHAAASSTTAHQSEFAFADAMIPVLVPATVQEIVDFGLMGYALSRFAGCWVAMKLAADIAEGAATIRLDHLEMPQLPEDFVPPPDGLHIRWPDRADHQEARLVGPKMRASQAFARVNRLDRVTCNPPAAKFGIAAAGKAWRDLRQALADLSLTESRCAQLGLRLYKIAMVWPLEPQGARRFASGLEDVLVIEEKRPLIESQLRDLLYDLPEGQRPRIIGKNGRDGKALLPSAGELTPHRIARVLVDWLGLTLANDDKVSSDGGAARTNETPRPIGDKPLLRRQPHFCSGCPHSRSTRTPEGSRSLAGIGCHTMALWTDGNTKTLTQMGGEGANWIGQAPFTATPHVFQNIGDGTFAHSGLLAIRAAVAAGVNITYRLLYNDAVAMTGGQAVEGALSVPRIARILEAEGVKRIIVAAEEPDRYPASDPFPPGVTVTGRDSFDCAQLELREVAGTTVLIFDQTCAAEKRRRRASGDMALPKAYAVINEAVCENCGDCVTASNCLSVVPVDTPFGRKRRIDQASCNADLSCVDGFCPSFVTVEGASLREQPQLATAATAPAPLPPRAIAYDAFRGRITNDPRMTALTPPPLDGGGMGGGGATAPKAPHPLAALAPSPTDGEGFKGGLENAALPPAPTLPSLERPMSLLIAGIGGTGVVTLGRILGRAAEIARLAVSVTDQTGLAQKGGAVLSHLRLAMTEDQIGSSRIGPSRDGIDGADIILGCDLVVTASADVLARAKPAAQAIVNDAQAITATFLREPDKTFPSAGLRAAITRRIDQGGTYVNATALAAEHTGRGATANILLLGYAWQKGLIPIGAAAIEQAMGQIFARRDEATLDFNRAAFDWGRRIAADGDSEPQSVAGDKPLDLDALIEHRGGELIAYQNHDLARRYWAFVAQVRAIESSRLQGHQALSEAVARNFFKLLAVKDEYDVARQLSGTAFHASLADQFAGKLRLYFHLAPSFLGRPGIDGRMRKRRFGPWLLPVLRLLASCRGLRGSLFDPFAHAAERKLERALCMEYEQAIAVALDALSAETYPLAVEIARLPESIRGFGSIKQSAAETARLRQQELLSRMSQMRQAPAATIAAE